MRVIFFLRCSKLNLNLQNVKKNKKFTKCFGFWVNCIWKCSKKMPLLRRQYLSSALNGLTNSPKILHIIQRVFSNQNSFHMDQYIWWRCCLSALNSALARLPYYLSKGPLKRVFFGIYLATFWHSVNSKIYELGGSSFFLNCSKLNLNSEHVFRFWDNSIWKCCNKSPLLRRQYLSSTVNGLTNSPNILNIIKRDFFNPNLFLKDQ